MRILSRLLRDFLGPGILAIAFIARIGSVGSSLVPFTDLIAAGPDYVVTQFFTQATWVPEDVVREILHQGYLDEDESVTSSRGVSELCDTIRKEALAFEDVCLVSGAADTERPSEKGSKTIVLPPIGLLDMTGDAWWPLHLVLADHPSGQGGRRFRYVWASHCFLILSSLIVVLIWRVYGLFWQVRGWLHGDEYCGDSTLAVFVIVTVPAFFMLVRAIRNLARTIRKNAVSLRRPPVGRTESW